MKDAQAFNVTVEKGDVIIMGSDGLSDNLVCIDGASSRGAGNSRTLFNSLMRTFSKSYPPFPRPHPVIPGYPLMNPRRTRAEYDSLSLLNDCQKPCVSLQAARVGTEAERVPLWRDLLKKGSIMLAGKGTISACLWLW